MANRGTYLKTAFLWAWAIVILVMSLHYFQVTPSGILIEKQVAIHTWYRLVFLVHILGGMIAIFVGPTQFIDKLRQTAPTWHRKLGYVYTIAVGLGGIAGLVVAPFAMGGYISGLGFACLASFWLISLGMAIRAAIGQDFEGHRRWMFINYGLTFSSITQRLMLLFAFTPQFTFIEVYRGSAWFPWMINTAIALWLYRRTITTRLAST